jgi:hypothetical protein
MELVQGPFTVNVPTFSGGVYTTPLSTSGTFAPSGYVEFMQDLEGTSKVYLFIRQSGTTGRIKAYTSDLSGATPTTPVMTFQTLAGQSMDSMVGASINKDNKLALINGAIATLNAGAYIVNTTFQLFDVYTNLASGTFKAGYADIRFAPGNMLFDNLNGQDYIYTMLLDILDQNNPIIYMAAIKISAMIAAQSGMTLQTGDIWTGTIGTKTDSNGLVYNALWNVGTFQYVMAFTQTDDSAVRLYVKNFATFGQNSIIR